MIPINEFKGTETGNMEEVAPEGVKRWGAFWVHSDDIVESKRCFDRVIPVKASLALKREP